jgi:hypothetical protein
MSTIYVQYITGNFKISINIKANHSLKVLPEKIDKKMKITSTREKCFWGAFHQSRKSDREIKIK